MRIFVNVSVILLLALSAYAVIKMVARSAEEFEQNDWWRQNEITVVMSLISYLFPMFFEILGLMENYHPRKQLRLQLARWVRDCNVSPDLSRRMIVKMRTIRCRIMVLNLLNLYSLIFALFGKINSMVGEITYKFNFTSELEMFVRNVFYCRNKTCGTSDRRLWIAPTNISSATAIWTSRDFLLRHSCL